MNGDAAGRGARTAVTPRARDNPSITAHGRPRKSRTEAIRSVTTPAAYPPCYIPRLPGRSRIWAVVSGPRGRVPSCSHRLATGRVVGGDSDEVLDELAAPGGRPRPGRPWLGAIVADVAVGDAGPGVEERGGQRQQDDAAARGPRARASPRRCGKKGARRRSGSRISVATSRHFWHRGGILEEMLFGEVGDGDRVLPRQPGGRPAGAATRGFGQQRPDLKAASGRRAAGCS